MNGVLLGVYEKALITPSDWPSCGRPGSILLTCRSMRAHIGPSVWTGHSMSAARSVRPLRATMLRSGACV